MSVSVSSGQGPDIHAEGLKLLSKAIKALDTAMLRFHKSVQEMQSAVGAVSSSLEDITACTAQLPLSGRLDDFNALCLSMYQCVAGIQTSEAAKAVADNDTYASVHKDLEALRDQTELLAACEKGCRRARDKWAKHASVSSHSRKSQQCEARLGAMTSELRALQKSYEYELPSTLCNVLHRVLRGNSQFCRSLGTTLLCCGNESRRYSQALQPPSAPATSANSSPAAPAFTDEQRKGLALQNFARDFFVSAPLTSHSFASLSGFCAQDDQDTVSQVSASSSGCTHSRLLGAAGGGPLLWSPVDAATQESQPLRLYEEETPLSLGIGNSCRVQHRSPTLPQLHTDTTTTQFAAPARPRNGGQVAPSPTIGRSLATLGKLVQLEQDTDCPF